MTCLNFGNEHLTKLFRKCGRRLSSEYRNKFFSGKLKSTIWISAAMRISTIMEAFDLYRRREAYLAERAVLLATVFFETVNVVPACTMSLY